MQPKNLLNKHIFFSTCLLMFVVTIYGQPITYNNTSTITSIGKQLQILEDSGENYDTASILNAKRFYQSKNDVPLFPVPNVNTWCRFTVNNNLSSDVYLFIEHFNISKITLYKLVNGKLIMLYADGNSIKHSKDNSLPSYISNLNAQPETENVYYLHIESVHPVVLSIFIGSYQQIQEQVNKQVFVVSAYFGILLSIFFYNLFLFFVTKDNNYFTYVLYIFFLGLAQLALAGYTFKYLWLSYPSINFFAVPVTSSLATIFGVLFSLQFLRVSYYSRIIYKILLATIFFSVVAIIASILHLNKLSYYILDYNTPAVGIFIIAAAIYIITKGFRPALYYAVSWLFFLAGLIIFSLRNLNVLPSNSFTTYILYSGSAIETVLLSIALADRINILKRETIVLQARALETSQENERLVKEQNVVLEQKVDQRTHELKESNTQLSVALDNLKDAQTQLVEAEKMASLGQLTAGIAHEINNPINFVKSNINPLRLDVKDLLDVLNEYGDLHKINEESTYKKKLSEIEKLKKQIDVDFVQKEIDSLIVGIEEGAERTAEIVQGLRTFSRLDEAELKTVDVHEGILSTLVILKNSTPYYVTIEKQFNAHGDIECYPGKLNQVFMNILTNSIQAITAKPEKNNPETIIITTKDIENDHMQISIKDSGIGMTEEVKHRIYEPFFTTKEVGEGTGLGMAIVFKIIQKHEGHIDIISEPCKGSEFIITLPHKHPISDHL